MRRIFMGLTLVIALILAWISSRTHAVAGADMAPSIMDGDLVVSVPATAILPGDVVLLQDPLDPARTVLRRVMAIGGQKITIAKGHIKVGKRRLRASAMGDMGPHLVAKETLWAKKPAVGAEWLTRIQAEPTTHWSAEPVTVPDAHIFLMADDRDHAVDSRWWGTIPTDRVMGIVRFRWGPAHTWRPGWEFLSGTAPLGA
jgi:signal peptidase I